MIRDHASHNCDQAIAKRLVPHACQPPTQESNHKRARAHTHTHLDSKHLVRPLSAKLGRDGQCLGGGTCRHSSRGGEWSGHGAEPSRTGRFDVHNHDSKAECSNDDAIPPASRPAYNNGMELAWTDRHDKMKNTAQMMTAFLRPVVSVTLLITVPNTRDDANPVTNSELITAPLMGVPSALVLLAYTCSNHQPRETRPCHNTTSCSAAMGVSRSTYLVEVRPLHPIAQLDEPKHAQVPLPQRRSGRASVNFEPARE